MFNLDPNLDPLMHILIIKIKTINFFQNSHISSDIIEYHFQNVCTLEKLEPPAGLEPAIPGLGGRCLIHWATEAISNFTAQKFYFSKC